MNGVGPLFVFNVSPMVALPYDRTGRWKVVLSSPLYPESLNHFHTPAFTSLCELSHAKRSEAIDTRRANGLLKARDAIRLKV